jgi:hypothetical protein
MNTPLILVFIEMWAYTMAKNNKKLFVLRKYVMASNAGEAVRLDKVTKVDDVWIDEEWKKGNANSLAGAIGFEVHTDDE